MARPKLACLFLILTGCWLGCAEPTADRAQPPSPPESKVATPPSPDVSQAADNALSHVIAREVEYYTSGPQQGRPPDGTFSAGTRVQIIEQSGSYTRVRSADGIEAYVAAEAIQAADRGGQSAAPD